MARVLIGAVVVAAVLTIFAVVDCAFTERRAIRALPRWMWILLILVAPVAGALLWLLVGRGTTRRRPLGPDDDPRFGSGPPPVPDAGNDEAFRQFEQELVDLDADPDDDEPR